MKVDPTLSILNVAYRTLARESITKTRLFKYTENFTTKKMKIFR